MRFWWVAAATINHRPEKCHYPMPRFTAQTALLLLLLVVVAARVAPSEALLSSTYNTNNNNNNNRAVNHYHSHWHLDCGQSHTSRPKHAFKRWENWPAFLDGHSGRRLVVCSAINKRGKTLQEFQDDVKRRAERQAERQAKILALKVKDRKVCTNVVWDNPTWDENIQGLLDYKAIYGTVNLPNKSKDFPNLGKWCNNLRWKKGRLSEEKIQQLESIGFLFSNAHQEKYDRQWEEMFQQLSDYRDEHGDCRVPINWKENKKLGKWVSHRRTYFRKEELSDYQIKKLKSIGFEFSLREFQERKKVTKYDKLWNSTYEELEQFKKVHGHCNVRRDDPENKSLAYWVGTQRTMYKRGELRADRHEKLEMLGFLFDLQPVRDDAWNKMYDLCKKYHQEREAISYSDKLKLGKWSTVQLTLNDKGTLDPYRKAMLDDIGFDWTWITDAKKKRSGDE